MQTKKLFLVLLVLIVVAGCTGGGGGKQPITGVDIYKGTNGLVMDFFKGVTPKEVYEKDDVPVRIEVKNDGAYSIDEGYLAVGIEEDYMSIKKDNWGDNGGDKELIDVVDDQHAIFNLKGKSIEIPVGEQGIIGFEVRALKIKDNQSEMHTSTIQVTACYKYQTMTNADVCIDTDIYDISKVERACEIKDITLNSQGAPVAVTKIETQVMPEQDSKDEVKLQFIIHIENKGNGEVFDKESIEKACSSESLSDETDLSKNLERKFNMAKVKAFLSKGEQLDCVPTDDRDNGDVVANIRLREKKAKVRCLAEGIEKGKGAYTSPLKIVIDYGYTFTIAKDVTIKKVTTY